MPLISIIIAVYNNEKYVGNAVKSVKSQNFEDYEIIIVDDGSTDRTPDIVDAIAREDSKVKVIHQENQWIYASFNNGIKAATGDYIYILNSDDLFFEGALLKMSEVVKKYDYPDVVYTKVHFCNCDLGQNIISMYDQNISISREEYINFSENENKWINIIKSGLMMNQANLYKRELAEKVPFRNDIVAGDNFFNITIAKLIKDCVVIPDKIYCYMYYGLEGMNASEGKYYGYEHEMFNEYYLKMKELLLDKGILNETNLDVIRAHRRSYLRREIRGLLEYDKYAELSQKIEVILNGFWDDIVEESFTLNGRNGFNELVSKELAEYYINRTI